MKPSLLFLLVPLIGCSAHSAGGGGPAVSTTHESVKSSAWIASYTAAMTQAAGPATCATFSRLANDSTSPIALLARVRYLEKCTTNGALTAAITELDGHYDASDKRWAKPIVSEVIVALATRANHRATLAKHALARSKDIGAQREKETLLQLGLNAARALGQTAQADALQTELDRVSPRLMSNPAQTEWMRVAEDFRSNEDWSDANRYYNKVIGASGTSIFDGFKARNGIREVEKAKFRFYNGPLSVFLSASQNVATYCESKVRANTGITADQRRIMFEAWMQYARDVWSYGDVEVAKREVTRTLGLTWLDPLYRAYTYWLQARIHANYSEWSKAATSGTNATNIMLADVSNSASWTDWNWMVWDEAHWQAAMAQRKLSQPLKSARLLEQAVARTRNLSSEIKFLFWAAQGEFDAGAPVTATEQWERLATLDPHGFYGFLAHHKLGRALTPLVPSDLSNVAKPSTMADADFDVLLWLTYGEELILAQKFSKLVMSATSVEVEDLLMRAFMHDFVTIQSLIFTRVDASVRNQFIADHGSLFYPRPYFDIVQAAVRRQPRIEAEYVYAVMRQESGFNTFARSWANAYGLLQLLPQIARGVQDKAGVYFTEDYELYRPSVNIPLGVAHMDDMIAQAGAEFIMRTAGYNAKVEKAKEWRERLYNGNVYEFIEEIPYDETRSYIRLVMRNYIMNKRLSSTQPFLFPAHLLAL